jgi:hypothetical protein
MMLLRYLGIPLCTGLLSCLPAGLLMGQEGRSDGPRREFSAIRDSIRSSDEELELLQHFLEASTVDLGVLQHSQVRAWILGNPVLRDSLFATLLLADSSIQSEAGADAEILATPQGDLVQVRFGTAVFKGMTLKRALDRSPDKSLYRKVASSARYSKDIELRDPSFRLETPLQPELLPVNQLLSIFDPEGPPDLSQRPQGILDLSIDQAVVHIGPKWGGELRLGADEINNPFWANASLAVLASIRRTKFGFVFPFAGGRENVPLFDPFLFRARRLSGGRGFMGQFDLGSLGGLLLITRFSEKDLNTVVNPNSFYYVSGILNLYYSFGVALDPGDDVRAKVGFGVHRVTHAGVVPVPGNPASTYVSQGELNNIVSPYLKVEYLNSGASDHVGASIQFYNLTLMFTGYMEIVPNLLGVELKYVWPLGGTLKEWEYPEFFLISPKIHLSF